MESQQGGLSDYFSALTRRRGLFLSVALPIALAVIIIAVAWPNIYISPAIIELNVNSGADNNSNRLPDYLMAEPGQPNYADQYVASLKDTVLSEDNMRQLLERFDLYPQLRHTDEVAAIKRLRSDIAVDIVTTQILDPRTGRERQVISAFSVGYNSHNRDKAQPVSAWLVSAFFKANRDHHQQLADNAAKFYGTESQRVGTEIAKLESKLADFKRKNLGQLPDQTDINMNMMDRTERDVGDIDSQLRALQEQRVMLNSQLAQMRTENSESGSIRDLQAEYDRKLAQYDPNHPDMVSLRHQIETLRQGGTAGVSASLQDQLKSQRAVLAQVRQRYSEDHPDVKRLERSVATLQARIAAGERTDAAVPVTTPAIVQLRSQIDSVDAQTASLERRSSELRSKLSGLEQRATSAPGVEREYQDLTRNLTINRAKYDDLLRRQMDAEVSAAAVAGGTVDDFRLVKVPTVPLKPAKPPRLVLGIIGVVMALALALTTVILVEAFDQTVRGNRDVRDLLSVAPLAAIPQIQNSAYRRRHARRVLSAAASLLIGLAILFVAIRQFA